MTSKRIAKSSNPSFKGRKPSSLRASQAKRATRNRNTRPELMLRRTLWHRGFRYRVHYPDLPGKPDIVFLRARVVVFVDGDFWHGRDWNNRKNKLSAGSNPDYWIAKIQRNRDRDREQERLLAEGGWLVLRVWEGEVLENPNLAADLIEGALSSPGHGRAPSTLED